MDTTYFVVSSVGSQRRGSGGVPLLKGGSRTFSSVLVVADVQLDTLWDVCGTTTAGLHHVPPPTQRENIGLMCQW